MTEPDWLEAFAAHPRIGDLNSLHEKFASTADLCRGEQAGAMRADENTVRELAEGNAAYEAKFGHIFIVCATGKSAAEMLAILRSRPHKRSRNGTAHCRDRASEDHSSAIGEAMNQLSTHILDTARGQPAAGVAVSVERLEAGGTWTAIGQGVTNNDGRIANLLSSDAEVTDGDYRFIFTTADYFRVAGAPTFYPEVTVASASTPAANTTSRFCSARLATRPIAEASLPPPPPLPETGRGELFLPLPASGRGPGG